MPEGFEGDNTSGSDLWTGSAEVADRLVTVFGGSGFIGRYLVQRLADAGDRVCVAVRDVENARFLKPMGDVGQIVPVSADIRDDDSVRYAVRGADAVIFSVGVLYNRGRQTFQSIHVEGAERIARAAVECGASRLVFVSALGADSSSEAVYAVSKAEGEARVSAVFPSATVVRPGVVFGAEDQFFNRFAAIARLSPVLPIFGHGLLDAGSSRLQPVYVGDVADAIVKILDVVASEGRTYELGGPRTYSYKEIMKLICRQTGRPRLLVPIPFWAAKIKALFLELLPVPPLTRDQLVLLSTDNVVADTALGFSNLGMTPSSVEAIVPRYLGRYRRRATRTPPTSS